MNRRLPSVSSNLFCSFAFIAALGAVSACGDSGGDDNDDSGGAGADDAASDSSSGGAGGEGSGSGGAAASTGGTSSDAQFEGTIYVSLERTVGPAKLGVFGVFVEPGSAADNPIEGQLNPLLKVIAGLDVGECGDVVAGSGSLDISPVEVGPTISLESDGTKLSVPVSSDEPGFYSFFDNNADFPVEAPVDFAIDVGQDAIEAGVVSAFGIIPVVSTINPGFGCSTTTGCEFGIASSDDLDEVFISFTAGTADVVCRGNATTKKVVVPGGMLTEANWGRLYGVTRIQKTLNGSPLQFLLVSSDAAYLSATDPG